MIILSSSDPSTASVAPYGGTAAVFTPEESIAIGIPTEGDPILIDISASITTNGMTGRLHGEGKPLPHAWVKEPPARGCFTDPGVLFPMSPGAVPAPAARTMATGGRPGPPHDRGDDPSPLRFGRADTPTGWGA